MRYRRDPVEDYYEWLLDVIRVEDYCDRYGRLLDYLSTVKFTWLVEHDDNRAEDGFCLRLDFANEYGCDECFWIDRLPSSCTVLEMMIALSMRCENVLHDPEYGDRTCLWFWEMIWNLGLDSMDTFGFENDICDEIIEKFLNREYKKNGSGGLFRCRNSEIDMRKAEIWYQMNVWLEENFEF